MGKHKEIQSILLRELSIGEERAERALGVIQHQQTTINQLEKDLHEQEKTYENIFNDKNQISVEDYKKIQDEVESLQGHLEEVKEIHSQFFIPGTNKIASLSPIIPKVESGVQTHEEKSVKPILVDSSTDPCLHEQQADINSDMMKELQPVLDAFTYDLNKTKKTVEVHSQKEITFKRKLYALRGKVKWLKQERDEVIGFLDELTEWRKHVEGILLDLSAGIQEDTGRVASGDVVSHPTRQIWKTARKYFTSDEAHFFLSHET